MSKGPMRMILVKRTELDTLGHQHLIGTLECGHEVITTHSEAETNCVQCRDEERFGSPAPWPPRES